MRYRELAERTVLEQNLAALNTALTFKFAALVAAGRPDAIRNEVGRNPVDLLARPPAEYLGELFAPAPETLPRPSWYFDRSTGELVYLPAQARFLTYPVDAAKGLRFRVALTKSAARPGEVVLRELAQPYIEPVVPYRWALD